MTDTTSRLSAADVRDQKFNMTKMRPGYDEGEVDAFMERVASEIATLTRERDEARAIAEGR